MSTTDEWTSLEKLLLVQSVYKLGEDSWTEVAHNLNQSTLLNRQHNFYNRDECFEQYSRLKNSVEKSEKESDSATSNTDETSSVLEIARALHIQRLEELRRAIEETNEKYATLSNEIDAIRVGKWDERLIAEEAAESQAAITSPTRTEPIINGSGAVNAMELEPAQVDDVMVTEILQPEEEESMRSQSPQEEKPASPRISTTPLSLLDNGSAVNTPLEQGPVTPAEAMVDAPSLPPTQLQPQLQHPLPTIATLSGTTAEAITETTMPLANDATAIMDRIESGSGEPAPAVETRQPESIVVQSVVEERTPREVLETASEPRITAQPTVSTQMQDDRQASEDSFHSAATEMEPKIGSEEQQLPAPSSSPGASPPPPPLQLPIAEESSKEEKPTEYVIAAEDGLDTRKLNWDNELKRKIEEDSETVIGGVEGHEVKRQRTGDGVTREISAETVLPNKEPSQESTEAKVIEMDTMENIDQLPSATTTTRTLHQDPDEESRSPDVIYPRSPEAPLSMTSGADAESVTGSESNAPTPTGSAPSSDNRRGGSSSGRSKDEQRQQKSWQKNINLLWREITNHKNGAMFMNPIKEATAPSYYDIVKHPMDLKAIKNRIRDGVIKSTVEFERDIVLMLTNSLMYNKEGTEMYQMAVEMLDDVTEQVKLFKTADSNSPPVSHTRKASTIAKDRRKSISDF